MENWGTNNQKEVVMANIEGIVPKDHLLRKIERAMDYEWIYARMEPYYCADNGQPGTDPVVLIKMVLIRHLFGIPSLWQTYREIQVNVAYRWFLGYNLLDKIPHFATVSYAFCNRFPPELSEEIFEHVLNKALNYCVAEPKMVFIDGTHIRHPPIRRNSKRNLSGSLTKISFVSSLISHLPDLCRRYPSGIIGISWIFPASLI